MNYRFLFGLTALMWIVFSFASCESNPNNNMDDVAFIEADTTMSDMDKELDAINKMLKNDVNNTGLYLKRARIYKENGNLTAAINDLNRAIKIDSLIPEFYLLKAELYKAQDDYKAAKQTLDKCLYIDNDNVQARVELGWLALYVTNHEQALDYADAALKRDMYHAEAYYLKGMIFLDKKDTALAISSFKTAVEQENDYYDAYIQLGMLHFNDPLGEGYFKNALRVDSNSLEALYNTGMYYQEKGKFDEAIALYKKAIALHPYREPYFNIAYIHHEYLQEYDKAVEWYTKAINIEPKYIDAYYNRGLCYELLNNRTNAKNDFQTVLKLHPTHTYAAIALERVL